MKVNQQSDHRTCQLVAQAVALERSVTSIVSALVRGTSHLSPLSLWPDPADAGESDQRSAWVSELEAHFTAVRRRARQFCPATMLPQFEDDLTEIEATVRGAAAGRVVLFWDLDHHIELVRAFGRRWVPYLDPPPPRFWCDETDRSVWLDGRKLAAALTREQFGFVQTVADAYPNAVKWMVIANTVPGCRGKNQTRLVNSLPDRVRNVIDSDATGYVLDLTEKLSTGVETA